MYDLLQFHCFNQRRKAIRIVTHDTQEIFKIDNNEIYSYYTDKFGNPNYNPYVTILY